MMELRWGERRPGGVRGLVKMTPEQRKRLARALGAGDEDDVAGATSSGHESLIREADVAIAKGERAVRILEGTARERSKVVSAQAGAVAALRARMRSGR